MIKVKEKQGKNDTAGYIVDYAVISDFCKILERAAGKNLIVYFCQEKGKFTMFAQSHLATVVANCDVSGGEDFNCGIPSENFINLSKKISSDAPIYFEPDTVDKRTKRQCFVIRQGNIQVSFPKTLFSGLSVGFEFKMLKGEQKDWLIEAISRCFAALGKSEKFPGILIDNSRDDLCRVANFRQHAQRMMTYKKLSLPDKRFIVTDDLAKIFRVMKNSIEKVGLSDNNIGTILKSGVEFYMPLLQDFYPLNYFVSSHIQHSLSQLDLSRNKNVFDKDVFLGAADLVASTSGQDERMLTCSLGYESERKHPVWVLEGGSENGTIVTEKVESLFPADALSSSFRILKDYLLDSVKMHDGNLNCYDIDQLFLAIANEDATDITLLQKAAL